jgi:hypothetical protein
VLGLAVIMVIGLYLMPLLKAVDALMVTTQSEIDPAETVGMAVETGQQGS